MKPQGPCTCHPDERPSVCMHHYAYRDCLRAYFQREALRRAQQMLSALPLPAPVTPDLEHGYSLGNLCAVNMLGGMIYKLEEGGELYFSA